MIFKGELKQENALQYYLDNYKDNVFYKVKKQATMDKTYALLADYFANLDLSWMSPKEQMAIIEPWATFELSNGLKGCIGKGGIQLSNGTRIVGFHALSVRRFDEKTNELVVSQNEFGNLSELRIPIELAKFLETASTPDAPGVKRTPIPDVDES